MGRRGYQASPRVIPVARHSVDPVRVSLDVAELTVPTLKNELNDVELMSFDDFYPLDSTFPTSLSPPVPTWLIVTFCLTVSIQWTIIGALCYLSFKLWLNMRELKTKMKWVQSSFGLDEPPGPPP